jgi:sec-independent protein translocase protein TatA
MFFAKPWWDALIVIVVVLLFFGPKRLPALGKSLGEGMREFKDSITGRSKDDDEEERTEIGEGGASAVSAASQPTATSAPPAEPASAPVQAPVPASTPEPESAGVASSEQRS